MYDEKYNIKMIENERKDIIKFCSNIIENFKTNYGIIRFDIKDINSNIIIIKINSKELYNDLDFLNKESNFWNKFFIKYNRMIIFCRDNSICKSYDFYIESSKRFISNGIRNINI